MHDWSGFVIKKTDALMVHWTGRWESGSALVVPAKNYCSFFCEEKNYSSVELDAP
jgi:hypothetical protein